jgi:Secretion system C-terminal sorting domain
MKKLILTGHFFLLTFVFSQNILAARFWVATISSNWNNTTNWSATSGGAGGASVPGIGDDVNFNNGGLGNCTVDASVSVKSITVTVLYAGTIIQGANTIAVSGATSFGGGTFTGGTADITITGAFALSGTTFTSTSAILELQDNAAFTGGSFAHNSGTVRFNCTHIVAETISGTSPAFYTLEFVGINRGYTISSTGNISVANNLIISGAGFYNLLTGTIDVKGDINVSNTAVGCGGDAMININGTITQNFNGNTTAGTGALPQLTINKTSGTLNLANFPAVSNNFTYTTGTVNAGTSTFCFTHGSIVTYSITGSLTLAGIEFIMNTSLTTITISAATTLSATGDLIIAGAGGVLINTGNINVNGNINLTNIATNGGGSTTINIIGAGNESIDGTAIIVNQSRLPVININKAGGILSLLGNISASANVTYMAGTVNAGTSTCYVVNDLTVTGNINLNNLTIQATANATLTITAGTTVSVAGVFDMENGANAITINGGTIAVQGNIVENNSSTTGGGTGTILINGSGAQNITSTGVINQGRFPAVTINKSGGTITFPALITVRGNWTYVSGTLDVTTNNSTVVLANILTIAGSHTLNNVTFEGNTNNTYTVATGTLLTVSGIFLTAGAFNVFITTPVSGATAIQAQGNITINNTSVGSGGAATILINGTGSQTFTGNAAAGQGAMPFLSIQKLTGTLTLIGTISESQSWTYNSGTVDATTNASKIVFGGNNLTITSAGMSFYDVLFTSNTSTLANSFSVNNNLTISGLSVLAPGSNTINLAGQWANWGSTGFNEAASIVDFNGAALQTITTPGGENFANVIVNNSATGIQLANAVAIATSLTMTQGNIDLNSNTLSLGTTAVLPGTLNYTSGTIINTGSFVRWFAKTTIAAGGVAGLFPVGTLTDYRPLNVSVPVAPTTGGTIAVSYSNATTNTTTSFPDGAATIVVRKDLNWGLITTLLAGGTYNLNISGTGYGLIGNVSDLRLTLAGSVVGTAGINAGTVSNPQVNRTGLTEANLNNTFYLASTNSSSSPLPITLISFTANVDNGVIKLNWETAAEVNNDHFTIQRSTNTIQWQDIQIVAGSGNTNIDSKYSAYDLNPFTGISFYRLEQTDLDGKYSFSMIRQVNLNTAAAITIYPNPATDRVYVSGTWNMQVLIFNIAGQQMDVPSEPNGNGVILHTVNLRAGIYFIHILKNGNSQTTRSIIKE